MIIDFLFNRTEAALNDLDTVNDSVISNMKKTKTMTRTLPHIIYAYHNHSGYYTSDELHQGDLQSCRYNFVLRRYASNSRRR